MTQEERKNYWKTYNAKRNADRIERYKKLYNVEHDNVVYGVFLDDELIYVGSSKQFARRVHEHKHSHGNTPIKITNEERERTTIEVLWHGDNHDHRKYQERELIKLHAPRFNTLGK